MIDEREVREMLRRRAHGVPSTSVDAPTAVRRARRRLLVNGVATVAAVAIAVVAFAGVDAIRNAPVPADPPGELTEELGIFAPVAGRIVYHANSDLWAVDPNAPPPASTLVRLSPEGAGDADSPFASFTMPLGWSSDGTKLLFVREDPTDDTFPYDRHLYVLHADGTETLVTPDPVGGAAISPDGSRVVFAADMSDGLYVVDAEGGQPVRIADGEEPTFSPDGSQIAYLGLPRSGCCVPSEREHVWVANADGSDAHEILTDEPALDKGVFGLTWSPAGDRIAMENTLGRHVAIYTFAPDGSRFTKVIDGGANPYWSPDGSQIAYVVLGGPFGLRIADADGSNVRAFGVASSGPWHPVGSAQVDEPTPIPTGSFERANGEVLRFTAIEADGDLVAVDPETGEERILLADVNGVTDAKWSADGRWVAFEMSGSLWAVDRTREPRRIFPTSAPYAWSPTDDRIAVIRDVSTLFVVDPSTGQVTELVSAVGDVTSAPVWSPDGTRIVFGARGGAVHSVDALTGERSLLVQLPGEDLDSIDEMAWSPDGSRLAIYNDLEPGNGRLFVMKADGSDVAVLADDAFVFGLDWSPDGSRLAYTEDHGGEFHVLVAPADGSTGSLVASLPNAPSNPVWSPDGSQIGLGHHDAFLTEGEPNLVIAADGSGDAVPLDDLTYESWRGGWYDCACDLYG